MLHLFLKTKRFIPNEFHNSFFDIDFAKISRNGYKTILCDLDNTLIPYDETSPTKEILTKFHELENLGLEIILLSNNIPQRLEEFTKDIEVEGFANAKKPLTSGIRKALNIAEINDQDKIVLIGDQLMTDIWAANRFGIYSILVNPLKKKTEKWYTKLNRRTEVKMLAKIKKNYSQKYHDLHLDLRK